jgi:hypothetical protein
MNFPLRGEAVRWLNKIARASNYFDIPWGTGRNIQATAHTVVLLELDSTIEGN